MDKVGENKDLEKKATDQRSPAWPQAQVSRSGLVWLPLPLEEAWGSWTLLLVPRALASQLETPASAPVSPAVCVCLSLILPTPLLYETGGTAPPPHLLPLLHPSFLIWKKHPVIRIPKKLPPLFHVTGAGAAGVGGAVAGQATEEAPPPRAMYSLPWPSQVPAMATTPQIPEDTPGARGPQLGWSKDCHTGPHAHRHYKGKHTGTYTTGVPRHKHTWPPTEMQLSVDTHTESWSTHEVATAQTHTHSRMRLHLTHLGTHAHQQS